MTAYRRRTNRKSCVSPCFNSVDKTLFPVNRMRACCHSLKTHETDLVRNIIILNDIQTRFRLMTLYRNPWMAHIFKSSYVFRSCFFSCLLRTPCGYTGHSRCAVKFSLSAVKIGRNPHNKEIPHIFGTF